MKVLLSILLFLAIVSSGCYSIETVESTNISSADVYQSYYIRADKDRTSVTATFRVGSKSGTTIDLDAPSKVEHNGKPIPEIAPSGWKGTTYEESSNKFVGKHQFVYTDGNGKVFRNEINFSPLEFNEKSIEKVSRSVQTLIPLSRPVGKNETVSAFVSGKVKSAKDKPNETATDSVNIKLDPSRSALIIEPGDLKNFIGDKIDVSLTIEINELLQQTSAKGGDVQIIYETQGISLPVVK
jgi:hypothetical protein